MRASIFAGSILALGVVLAGCGGSSKADETTATPARTATAVATRPSDSNITPVSSGATTTATAVLETATATVPATAEATSTTVPATATNPPPAANTPAPTAIPQPTATPTQPAASGNPLTAFVGVSGSSAGYRWSPFETKIAPGGVVTFAWSGGAAHDLSIPQIGFQAKIDDEGNHPVTFPAAGRYSINCVVHPSMRGIVVVQ